MTNSLETLLAAASTQQAQGGTSLEMIAILLQLGRPHHFEHFEAFSAWRSSFAGSVVQSLVLGAAGGLESLLGVTVRVSCHHSGPPVISQLPGTVSPIECCHQ